MNTANLIATSLDYSGATGPFPVFRIVDLLPADELAAMGDAIHETVDRVARALRTPYADSAPEQDNPKVLDAIAQVSGPFEPTGMTIRVRVNVPAMPQTLHGWHSDVAIPRPAREDSTCHTLLGAC